MAALVRKRNTRTPGNGNESMVGSNLEQAQRPVAKSSFNPDSFEPGQAKEGETPGDFAGIWKGPLRDLKTMRKKAGPKEVNSVR